MRWKITAAALLATGLAGAATLPADACTVHETTKKNVLAAMHGEAFAHAKYHAYAAQAQRTAQPSVARLFTQTAQVEIGQHFREEAGLIGFVGDNAANLRDAIAGESYEATTMYPSYARQAAKDGFPQASQLFTEIAKDEANHRDWFAAALKAITGGGGTIPDGPTARPVTIPAEPAKVGGATRDNTLAAMHGEAFAYGKYRLYAEQARRTGQPRLAALFERTAQVELTEHFAEEAVQAGLVSDNATNLRDSIKGETYEAREMYPSYADQAAKVGDTAAADRLREISRDEARHADQYTTALRRLSR